MVLLQCSQTCCQCTVANENLRIQRFVNVNGNEKSLFSMCHRYLDAELLHSLHSRADSFSDRFNVKTRASRFEVLMKWGVAKTAERPTRKAPELGNMRTSRNVTLVRGFSVVVEPRGNKSVPL